MCTLQLPVCQTPVKPCFHCVYGRRKAAASAHAANPLNQWITNGRRCRNDLAHDFPDYDKDPRYPERKKQEEAAKIKAAHQRASKRAAKREAQSNANEGGSVLTHARKKTLSNNKRDSPAAAKRLKKTVFGTGAHATSDDDERHLGMGTSDEEHDDVARTEQSVVSVQRRQHEVLSQMIVQLHTTFGGSVPAAVHRVEEQCFGKKIQSVYFCIPRFSVHILEDPARQRVMADARKPIFIQLCLSYEGESPRGPVRYACSQHHQAVNMFPFKLSPFATILMDDNCKQPCTCCQALIAYAGKVLSSGSRGRGTYLSTTDNDQHATIIQDLVTKTTFWETVKPLGDPLAACDTLANDDSSSIQTDNLRPSVPTVRQPPKFGPDFRMSMVRFFLHM
jgi:hypothetical protein